MILGYSRLLWTGWRLRNVSFFIAQITASTVTPNSFATCSAYSRHSSRLPDLQIIYPTSPDGNVTGPLHLIIFTGFSPITCLLIDLSFRRCSYHSDRSPLFGSCIPCLPFHIKKDENLFNIHTLSGLEWPPPFFHGTYAPAVGLLCIFADAFPRIALCRNRTGLWTAHAESALSCTIRFFSGSASCKFFIDRISMNADLIGYISHFFSSLAHSLNNYSVLIPESLCLFSCHYVHILSENKISVQELVFHSCTLSFSRRK